MSYHSSINKNNEVYPNENEDKIKDKTKDEGRGRGSLIILEGLDRCGKSTQSKLLCEQLKIRNIPYIHLVFPDRDTAIGKTINDYLTNKSSMDDRVIHLLFSINRWEKNKTIIDALEQGIAVICDRYTYSGVAFTVAKGYDIEWCFGPDKGLPEPDLVFYLDIDPKISQNRSGYGSERYENFEFQTKVRDVFNKLFMSCDNVVTIDGSQKIDDIHSKILLSTLDIINDSKYKNINLLS